MKSEFLVERDGRRLVLYAGLLDLAHERGLKRVTTALVQAPSELNGMTAIVHAEVETAQGTFTGLGDASPGNVTRLMAPHLIRMAETRAKARALRDAVNVGVTALEELGDDDPGPARAPRRAGQAVPPADAERGEPVDGARRWPRATTGSPLPGATRPPTPDGPRGADLDVDDESPHPADVAGIQAEAERRGPIPLPPRDGGRPGAPATPRQLQTISRMARAAGKTVPTDGLSRSRASELISGLVGELGELGR
jgi:hypothetical protein